ncbi:MAG: hypothetical protein JOZ11_09055 [Alphaproteobacteria bacterium]|nr:hypothetical protein [Alphaproteobacteria bacterium]
MSPELARMFEQAGQLAQRAGDRFVTVERLLLALAAAAGTGAAKALAAARVDAQSLNRAIEEVRKGRKADSASAEEGYDAPKKYTRDLTEAARNGKLDPVIRRDEEIWRTIQVLSRRTKNNPLLPRHTRRRCFLLAVHADGILSLPAKVHPDQPAFTFGLGFSRFPRLQIDCHRLSYGHRSRTAGGT